MTAARLLAEARANDEHNLGVATLVDADRSGLLFQLASAWPIAARRFAFDPPEDEQVPADLLPEDHARWLWSFVEPCSYLADWARMIGQPAEAAHVQRAQQTLIDIGAVFPDGGLSRWVQRLIERHSIRLGVLRAPAPPERPDPPRITEPVAEEVPEAPLPPPPPPLEDPSVERFRNLDLDD